MASPRRAATREEPVLRPAPSPSAARPSPPARRRLRGVDAARGIALLGMAAVHVVDPVTADGAPHPAFLWFSGRASVLFVLLAGVGLALSTGGTTPAAGARRAALRRRIARRAGLLFVLGLACATLGVPVAVILCHYALLFLLALPLLGLRARALGAIAGAWLVLGPVAVFTVVAAAQSALGREGFFVGGRLWLSPAPADLLRPGLLLADLTATGYYPVLSWGAFLVLGLALGRLPLGRPRVAAGILGGGAVAWAAAGVVGAAVLRTPGTVGRIAGAIGADPAEAALTLHTGEPRLALLIPDPLWLALPVPHSGSVVAAVLAAGWACSVLGVCLLARPLVEHAVLRPLTGAGRIPLTLYVGHLVVLALVPALGLDPADGALLAVLVVLCLAAGWAAERSERRGPLEAAVARLSRAGEAPAALGVR